MSIISNDAIIDRMYLFNKEIHKLGLDMAFDAGRKGSHIGGSFSCMEIFSVLYAGVLKYDVSNPNWDERDRFIPSKTHCILANFASLVEAGFIQREDAFSFHKDSGLLAGHPRNLDIGLEFSGGSLGMGISVGIGMALNAKRYDKKYHVYVLLGDGECNEGSVWEAFMSAAQYKLDNITAIIDYNNMQFDGPNDNIMSISNMKERMESFGWNSIDVNGHSIEEVYEACCIRKENHPVAIIAHTKKANGIPSLENKPESHHASIMVEEYEKLKKEIAEGKYDRV